LAAINMTHKMKVHIISKKKKFCFKILNILCYFADRWGLRKWGWDCGLDSNGLKLVPKFGSC